ncbi:hypothetical protein D623_10031187 [Myotis brandtii]|uniref:Secreted protein n=1 Tax=Myotis brandtii TaxID=109478 RepID=S7PQE7_MYOBR|nr:hypothetical protein D623_10031187 [Myotis brandtii]
MRSALTPAVVWIERWVVIGLCTPSCDSVTAEDPYEEAEEGSPHGKRGGREWLVSRGKKPINRTLQNTLGS